MTGFSSPTHTRYFVIDNNECIIEYISMEDCNAQKGVLIKIKDEFREYSTYPGFEWRISNFTFYHEYPKETKLVSKGWTIEKIEVYRIISDTLQFRLHITDPFKELKVFPNHIKRNNSRTDPNANDINLIVFALRQLKNYSRYNSWLEMDLREENERLNKEIARLEAELKNH